MPPPVLLDVSQVDFSRVVADREGISRVNPQRFEFQLLDAIVSYDVPSHTLVGYHDVRPDAWWARAHIPGRPIFPGVLMIEAAAQLASCLYHRLFSDGGFLGFAGVDGVKFRGAVQPPARLVLVARGRSMRARRVICDTQGFVDGVMVYEGEITGMPV